MTTRFHRHPNVLACYFSSSLSPWSVSLSVEGSRRIDGVWLHVILEKCQFDSSKAFIRTYVPPTRHALMPEEDFLEHFKCSFGSISQLPSYSFGSSSNSMQLQFGRQNFFKASYVFRLSFKQSDHMIHFLILSQEVGRFHGK